MAERQADCGALCAELDALGGVMLERARRADWDAVEAGDRQRRALLERLFARPIPAELAPRVRDCLQRLLERDAEIMTHGRREMDELGRQLKRFSRGRQARRAYTALER